MVTNANPYQQLFWKKDIRFHVQWELERLLAQNDTITWEDFQANDFGILAGDVREVMPKSRECHACGQDEGRALDYGRRRYGSGHHIKS
jgi:hypothetical protein